MNVRSISCRVVAYFVETCHCDLQCNKKHTDNCWHEVEVDWSISKAFALAMTSYTMYYRTYHASHVGLISQDSSVDAAAN